MATEHYDLLVVGAGLSGISAGYFMKKQNPDKTFAILEGREAMGGTWDLFQYPGIRSDSDMHTLGFAFSPWKNPKAIADGPSILSYINETAKTYNIEQHIKYQHFVKSAAWSTNDSKWTVQVQLKPSEETVKFTCNFLYMCSGYYRYDEGYTPDFEGRDNFKGDVIHPQLWPQDLDYTGKRVIVIGSGATAVTIVPAMADKVSHITMLQRSPTYIIGFPEKDVISNTLGKFLPQKLNYDITRWKNICLAIVIFQLSKRRPQTVKKLIKKYITYELGSDYDIDTHLTPDYNPWEERMCLAPDADFFKALKGGNADIVTDHIDTFTKKGILLKSGVELEADIIITATGLNMVPLGNVKFTVDDAPLNLAEKMVYKGLMLQDVPNLAFAMGYTNASWTLKADLASAYMSRLLQHMSKNNYKQCTPNNKGVPMSDLPFFDLKAGYINRSKDIFPKQGVKAPWKMNQNYLADIVSLRYGSLENSEIVYS